MRGLALLLAVLMIAPEPALLARGHKGDRLYKEAQQAEAAKDYEKALRLYESALNEDSTDPRYDMGAKRARFELSQVYMAAAKGLREKGQLEDAMNTFEKAFATDPANALALQEAQHTSQMISAAKSGATKPGEENLTPAERVTKRTEARIASMLPLPTLKPVTDFISTLKMNNQPIKVLYETVGKYAGVNVIFDNQMQATAKNVNVEISNNTVEEAFDYIALLTKTYWKPVTANTILVTDDNVTKRRDYEDFVVKVFYLKNMTSVQEFQELVTAVRSVTDIRRLFTFNAHNAIVVRGSADAVALAEKLVHDLDKPKSEVVVDFVVMEANSDRTRDISMTLSSGSTNGLSLPIGFSPRNPILSGTTGTTGTTGSNGTTTGTGTGTQTSAISLAQIGKIGFGDFSASLPSALLQAVMSDNTTRVIQKPQVRASDGQKVTLKIGDKVPYATGSFQPGFAGSVGGVSPLVSTQFQFAETGVNVEVTPHVNGADEVTLHVLIDISNISQQVTIGGLQQPVISQRKSEADIRLRNGEVNILGGLTQVQDTKSISGLPGLTYIPVLGHLFGDNNTDKQHRELLIALIPHIVRSQDITPLDTEEMGVGTEQTIHLNFARAHKDEGAPASTAPPAKAPAAEAPTVQPNVTPGGVPALALIPTSVKVALSSQVVEILNAQNVTDLASAGPIHIRWDPKLLRLDQISPGDFMKQDGQNPPIIDIRNDTGEATITVTRTDGVSGSGVVAKLSFTAIGKGSGSIAITDATLKNSKQQVIPVSRPTVPVIVQ